MVGQRILDPFIGVRIPARQQARAGIVRYPLYSRPQFAGDLLRIWLSADNAFFYEESWRRTMGYV